MRAWLAAGFVLSVAAARLAADEAAAPSVDEPPITDAERDHWAYRPLADVDVPAVDDARWNKNPIDRFIKSALDERSIEPLPRAGRLTRLRRLSFDLTGLPPTSEQVREFLADDSPDAYERLVDRLLATTEYGERWAQHWLDLARFAETDGFEHDLVRPNAWRYRDWVIDAINRDVPFDEFVRLQLAGDELHPDDPQAAIATGFLLCGPDMPDINLQDERRHVVLNEMTATVGSVFLGLQFGCAQCHDHKYDPIRQFDFYRLRAFFESSDFFREFPIPTAEELAARKSAEAAWSSEDHRRAQKRRALHELAARKFRERNPDEIPTDEQLLAELSEEQQKEFAELEELLSDLPRLPELPMGRVMRDGEAREGHLFLRGDFRQPGPMVQCGFPRVVATESEDPAEPVKQPRATLANWLTSPANSLTSRAIVNRVWQWHFGVGLCASSSDFGAMGDVPTHPELLDWLAGWFVTDGSSFKRLHKLLVTSEAYQTASAAFDPEWSEAELAAAKEALGIAAAEDPDNTLCWHFRRARLDGEAIRDAMLLASNRLSSRRGGPGIRPPLPPEVTTTLLSNQWEVNGDAEDHCRRSIYLFVRRNLRFPLFDVFDRPDTNASCARRHTSTTPTQSLVLLNSEFSLDCARQLAAVIERVAPDSVPARIEEAYLKTYGRPPSAEELKLAQDFLDQQEQRLRAEHAKNLQQPGTAETADSDQANRFAAAAWVDLCLALFNSNEFVNVD